jgi:TATA-binding protein-associated factor
VRRTAAKQLSEITVKSFTFTSTPAVEDVKPDTTDDKVILDGKGGEDEAWAEALGTVAKIVPLLRSKNSETRHAASHALGLLASSLPVWLPSGSAGLTASGETAIPVSQAPLDLASLLLAGNTLLASAGREYISKPMVGDKAKRRKAMMGSLGLGDADLGDDVDKVLGEEDEGMEVDSGEKMPGERSEGQMDPPKDLFDGLSQRQIMMLKRKKGNIAEEANK